MVKKNLILLGMMAVGKTTLGKIVAIRQNLTFIDTDVVIEKKISRHKTDRRFFAPNENLSKSTNK